MNSPVGQKIDFYDPGSIANYVLPIDDLINAGCELMERIEAKSTVAEAPQDTIQLLASLIPPVHQFIHCRYRYSIL